MRTSKEKRRFEFADDTALLFYNNFEVAHVPFFFRPEVRHWTAAVMDSGGIYKYRWGDAVLRYLTLALFAEPNQIMHARKDVELPYCHPC